MVCVLGVWSVVAIAGAIAIAGGVAGLLDATVACGLLVPALMSLMGKIN